MNIVGVHRLVVRSQISVCKTARAVDGAGGACDEGRTRCVKRNYVLEDCTWRGSLFENKAAMAGQSGSYS